MSVIIKMMFSLGVVLFQFSMALAETAPSVVYVDVGSTAVSPDGASWQTAYPLLTAALASDLTAGQEIWVAEGTYLPTDDTDRNASFILVGGVGLYGGFNGSETIRAQRDWKENATILSGEIGDQSTLTDNSLHVVVGSDYAILDGFTIRDGYAVLQEGEVDTSGSLVEIPPGAEKHEILHTITNIKSTSGGGLLNVHAGTITKNCTFVHNHAAQGGAVYNMITSYFDPENLDSTVTGIAPFFKNCIFENNFASVRGGAVNNDFYTTSTFVNSVFSNNSSSGKGGAVYGDLGSPINFINVMFVLNSAERGAALVADGASPHRIAYGTFVYNQAADIGAALYQGSTIVKQQDGDTWIGNEVHLYGSIIIGNANGSSSSSISNWHDSIVVYDDETIVEDTDGILEVHSFLNPSNLSTRSRQYGWHPARKADIDYWVQLFENDSNRTYSVYDHDTSTSPGATGRVIYVDSKATGEASGETWTDAYVSLADALLSATTDSEIWVVAGTYKPTRGTDRSATFVMKEGVTIYGGFVGNELTVTDRNYLNNSTILSGDIGVVGDALDNSYHVVYGASGARLDGFTVRGGNADGDFHHSRGGGLLCVNTASPDIVNCNFTENIATEGGAIACYSHSTPTLINCIISGNAADIGGGLLLRTGSLDEHGGAKIYATVISDNFATDRGGAVYIDYGAWPTFMKCSISENLSIGNGGAVYIDNNSSQLARIQARFSDCDFTNNLTEQKGGAFAIYEGIVYMERSIIEYNSAMSGGGGIALGHKGKYVNIGNSTAVAHNFSTTGLSDIDDPSNPMESFSSM